MHERVSGVAMVIARNSRNFQRSPFGKTGGAGAVVCRYARYDALGITSANGRMVKMVKRRKWKSASERNEVHREEEEKESSVKSSRTARTKCIRIFNIALLPHSYLRSFARKYCNHSEERNIFRRIIDILFINEIKL